MFTDTCHSGNSNIACAVQTPSMPPMTCALYTPRLRPRGFAPQRKGDADRRIECAPESGPNTRIRTARIAPVGSVAQESKRAVTAGEPCAMIPERRRRRAETPCLVPPQEDAVEETQVLPSFLPFADKAPRSSPCDSIQLLLQAEQVERFHRKAYKNMTRFVSIRNASANANRVSASVPSRQRVGQAPMGRHRLSWPDRACLCAASSQSVKAKSSLGAFGRRTPASFSSERR